MNKPLISIILPAYNEEAIIESSLRNICDYLERLRELDDFEIIVVDDGSSDKTWELANGCKSFVKNLITVRHPVNLNVGSALKTGFAHAKGEYIVTYDIDLSYSTEHIGKLVDTIISTKADIVVASPYMKGGKVKNVPFLRKSMSRVVNIFMSRFSQHNLSTYTSMVRAYQRDFIKSLNLKAMDFEINPEILYKAFILRARIIEIPAELNWEFQNEVNQKRNSGMRIRRGVFSGLMAAFIFRPYMFFFTIGFILLLIFLYMFTWINIHIYNVYPEVIAQTTYFDDRFSMAIAEVFRNKPHSFLVSGFVLIAALQFLSIAFISLQKKRYFEELFHISTRLVKDNSSRKND